MQENPANYMQIQIYDQKDANSLVKISGIGVITLYDVGTNVNSM